MEDYKYLGVLFNYNGRFREGEREHKEQATRAMHLLIGKCRKFDLPADIQTELFNTTVLPVLTYASEIWEIYRVRELDFFAYEIFKRHWEFTRILVMTWYMVNWEYFHFTYI